MKNIKTIRAHLTQNCKHGLRKEFCAFCLSSDEYNRQHEKEWNEYAEKTYLNSSVEGR